MGYVFSFSEKYLLTRFSIRFFLFTNKVIYCRWFIVVANLNNHAAVRLCPDVRSRHGGERSHLISLDRYQVTVKIWDTMTLLVGYSQISTERIDKIHYSRNTTGNITTEVRTSRNWEFDGNDAYDGGAILLHGVLEYVQMNQWPRMKKFKVWQGR